MALPHGHRMGARPMPPHAPMHPSRPARPQAPLSRSPAPLALVPPIWNTPATLASLPRAPTAAPAPQNSPLAMACLAASCWRTAAPANAVWTPARQARWPGGCHGAAAADAVVRTPMPSNAALPLISNERVSRAGASQPPSPPPPPPGCRPGTTAPPPGASLPARPPPRPPPLLPRRPWSPPSGSPCCTPPPCLTPPRCVAARRRPAPGSTSLRTSSSGWTERWSSWPPAPAPPLAPMPLSSCRCPAWQVWAASARLHACEGWAHTPRQSAALPALLTGPLALPTALLQMRR